MIRDVQRFSPAVRVSLLSIIWSKLAPAIFRDILRPEQIGPEFAIAQPNDYVIRGEVRRRAADRSQSATSSTSAASEASPMMSQLS